MAISSWPDDVQLGQVVPCAICRRDVELANATAGRYHQNGHQSFACDTHCRDLTQLVAGWINFMTLQT